MKPYCVSKLDSIWMMSILRIWTSQGRIHDVMFHLYPFLGSSFGCCTCTGSTRSIVTSLTYSSTVCESLVLLGLHVSIPYHTTSLTQTIPTEILGCHQGHLLFFGSHSVTSFRSQVTCAKNWAWPLANWSYPNNHELAASDGTPLNQ